MKNFLICLSLYFFIFYRGILSGQEHIALCKKNETVIFSFMTEVKKVISLCTAEDESYLIYRYGTKNRTELEFPQDKTGSWSRFKYSYFIRGGAENQGLDLSYLMFDFSDLRYTVYEEYSSIDAKKVFGIKITDAVSGKETIIPGIPGTASGSLVVLRDYSKIQVEE